jgi:hypothetical protein
MKHRNSVLGFIAAVSLTLRDGDATHAQGPGIAQEVQTYAGDLFADRLGSRQEYVFETVASIGETLTARVFDTRIRKETA